MKKLSFVLMLLSLGACATLPQSDPVQVTIAGVESLPGEGLEVRMLVKLRVQNPNDQAIAFNGAYVRLDVMNKVFASGVSGEGGSVPRFGETLVAVPVTVSVLRMARQVMGALDGRPVHKVVYVMSGKLNTTGFRSVRFKSQGEFRMPQTLESLPNSEKPL
jgi:LEA14-like dessication related protein